MLRRIMSGAGRPCATSSEHTTESAPGPGAARRTRVDQDGEIVVRRGDTLWSLAERHLGPGVTDGEIVAEWPRWFAANRAVIGSDPDLLLPGERLRPPEPGAYSGPYRTETKTDVRSEAKAEPEVEIRGAW